MEINVLVVDDSALMRNLVSRIVDSAPDMQVVGTAMNGEFALQKIERLHPDIIVLDLEMPVMSGIEFLQQRQERGIEIPVIILSSVAQKGARITMEALTLGATDFITKPSGSVSHDIHVVGEQLVAMIRGYGGHYRSARGLTTASPPPDHAVHGGAAVHSTTAPRPAPDSSSRTSTPPPREQPRTVAEPEAPRTIYPAPSGAPGPLELIVLGISTGGPSALRTMFGELDASIGVPVVVVQHMPAGFTSEFARSLDRVSALEVKEAAEGDLLKPGRALIAPGDYHIEVEKRSLAGIAHLNQNETCNGHRPSAGVLFRSAAAHYGNRVMAVIMTGMGRDGADEIGAIWSAGGMTLGQDETSSVVYGMPRVAWENGYIHTQVSLSEMAATINRLAHELRAH